MSQILALSFDADASPVLRFEEPREQDEPSNRTVDPPGIHGWGVGWYPNSERGASVLKDPASTGGASVSDGLRDWKRFRGTTFVCHLRGHMRRRTQQDAQPFLRSYGGRQWIFAHDGDLHPEYAQRLPLGPDPTLDPLGGTDSEHAFCWLLGRLRDASARSLGEVDPEQLRAWFTEINAGGKANIVLADGDLLLAWRDSGGAGDLLWTRLVPPHVRNDFESDSVRITLDPARDANRTALIFSSQALSAEPWYALEPGQTVITRRGSVVFDSAPAGIPPQLREKGPAVSPMRSEAGHQLAAVEPLPASTHPLPVIDRAERLLQILHETRYRYAVPVERSSHKLLLHPMEDGLQKLEDFQFEMTPPGVGSEFEDVFGNLATVVEIDAPYGELLIRATSRVRVKAPRLLEMHFSHRRERIPLAWMPWQRQMLSAYLLPPELPETQLEELSDFATSFVQRNESDLVATLVDMNETIHRDFEYVSGSTTVATTPFEVFQSRRGVCQDFANLMICLARLLSVPARYRMGYIFTGADYENKIQSDASHAWVELYIPRIGWKGFDPTNGRQAGAEHVRVACGRTYRDASPTSGTIYQGGGTETLDISVRVEEIS
ncbi:MAG: transglutaminase [Myxococcales bacterium]|nr:transglutaminase [Myxococcales bacterium]